jgi:hypothetical protein
MSKHSGVPYKVVWRVSADAPQGEYVDSRADETKAREARRPRTEDDVPTTNWMQSSMELADGLDVIDRTDSMSNEWFDRWFRS